MNSIQRRFHWLVRLSVGLSVVLGVCGHAHAMAVIQRDFPQLVARAEQIVVGKVTDITTDTDSSGAPVTLVTFSDLTVLKGDVGTTLTLRLFGGPHGHVTVHIADMPTFTLGERDVLFVAGNGRDICPLVGVWQGRFHVRFDADQGTDVVEGNDRTPVVGLAGSELLRGQSGGAAAATSPMSLRDFQGLIADELAHPTASDAPTQ